ncbi:hypothetical protein DPX16_21759 [Anabarilius grahami]|uniref:Uncharacterized protein n=1 Tax=Anabarilius grahami TaxID=495550 RepID=A0A3N0YJZ4_ANAGA|nr:hypothetical protein DPX16_21759 [Anabarilius grahami]
MKTLYDLSDLRESRFGQPHPRHGLNLLWWFAHDCVQIDFNQSMIACCNPENGAFGFHQFYNAGGLLPYSNLPYYEVGNLNTTDSLPEYVTEKYTGCSDESNTDRIIVSFDSRWNRFDSIYVTRHSDLARFDQNHTYCISIQLLKEVKGLNHAEFLRKTMNAQSPYQMNFHQNSNIYSQFTASSQSLQGQRSHQSTLGDCEWCAILLFVLFIFACLFVFLMKK